MPSIFDKIKEKAKEKAKSLVTRVLPEEERGEGERPVFQPDPSQLIDHPSEFLTDYGMMAYGPGDPVEVLGANQELNEDMTDVTGPIGAYAIAGPRHKPLPVGGRGSILVPNGVVGIVKGIGDVTVMVDFGPPLGILHMSKKDIKNIAGLEGRKRWGQKKDGDVDPRLSSIGQLGDLFFYFVDGDLVRDNLEQDFTAGGTASRYPKFIPHGEGWIDNGLDNGEDVAATMIHEYTEFHKMDDDDESYNVAHDEANKPEHRFRKENAGKEVTDPLLAAKAFLKISEVGSEEIDDRAGLTIVRQAASIVDLKGLAGIFSGVLADATLKYVNEARSELPGIWNSPLQFRALVQEIIALAKNELASYQVAEADGYSFFIGSFVPPSQALLSDAEADDRYKSISVEFSARTSDARGVFFDDLQKIVIHVSTVLAGMHPLAVKRPDTLYSAFNQVVEHELRHAADWAYQETGAGEGRFEKETFGLTVGQMFKVEQWPYPGDWHHPDFFTIAKIDEEGNITIDTPNGEKLLPEKVILEAFRSGAFTRLHDNAESRFKEYYNTPTEMRSFAGNVAQSLWRAYKEDWRKIRGSELINKAELLPYGDSLKALKPENRKHFLQMVIKALEQLERDSQGPWFQRFHPEVESYVDDTEYARLGKDQDHPINHLIKERAATIVHLAFEDHDLPPDPELTTSRIRTVLTPELLKEKYLEKIQQGAHPLTGHAYHAVESLYHLLGGAASGYSPMQIRHEGTSHWYLQGPDGKIYDPTAATFSSSVPYEKGRQRMFLTTEPSARATKVMDRIHQRYGMKERMTVVAMSPIVATESDVVEQIASTIVRQADFNLTAGRLEDVKAKYLGQMADPENPQNHQISQQIDQLSAADPSKQNKYLSWMADQVIGQRQDPNTIIDLVKRFHAQQGRIDKEYRDINKLDPFHVEWAVEKAERNPTHSQEKAKAKEGASFIASTPEYDIAEIKNKNASCHFGRDTKWCITMKNEHWYEDYAGQGIRFFFVLPKRPGGEKFAVAAHPDFGAVEVYDAVDNLTSVGQLPLGAIDVIYRAIGYSPERGKAVEEGFQKGENSILELIQDPYSSNDVIDSALKELDPSPLDLSPSTAIHLAGRPKISEKMIDYIINEGNRKALKFLASRTDLRPEDYEKLSDINIAKGILLKNKAIDHKRLIDNYLSKGLSTDQIIRHVNSVQSAVPSDTWERLTQPDFLKASLVGSLLDIPGIPEEAVKKILSSIHEVDKATGKGIQNSLPQGLKEIPAESARQLLTEGGRWDKTLTMAPQLSSKEALSLAIQAKEQQPERNSRMLLKGLLLRPDITKEEIKKMQETWSPIEFRTVLLDVIPYFTAPAAFDYLIEDYLPEIGAKDRLVIDKLVIDKLALHENLPLKYVEPILEGALESYNDLGPFIRKQKDKLTPKLVKKILESGNDSSIDLFLYAADILPTSLLKEWSKKLVLNNAKKKVVEELHRRSGGEGPAVVGAFIDDDDVSWEWDPQEEKVYTDDDDVRVAVVLSEEEFQVLLRPIVYGVGAELSIGFDEALAKQKIAEELPYPPSQKEALNFVKELYPLLEETLGRSIEIWMQDNATEFVKWQKEPYNGVKIGQSIIDGSWWFLAGKDPIGPYESREAAEVYADEGGFSDVSPAEERESWHQASTIVFSDEVSNVGSLTLDEIEEGDKVRLPNDEVKVVTRVFPHDPAIEVEVGEKEELFYPSDLTLILNSKDHRISTIVFSELKEAAPSVGADDLPLPEDDEDEGEDAGLSVLPPTPSRGPAYDHLECLESFFTGKGRLNGRRGYKSNPLAL